MIFKRIHFWAKLSNPWFLALIFESNTSSFSHTHNLRATSPLPWLYEYFVSLYDLGEITLSCIRIVVEVMASSELVGSDCRCCATKWWTYGFRSSCENLYELVTLWDQIVVKILHCSEGGDIEQVARTLKHILVFAIAFFLSLNSTTLFISCRI